MDQVFPATPQPGRLHLLLRGTNFQLKVWEALLRLPPEERDAAYARWVADLRLALQPA